MQMGKGSAEPPWPDHRSACKQRNPGKYFQADVPRQHMPKATLANLPASVRWGAAFHVPGSLSPEECNP